MLRQMDDISCIESSFGMWDSDEVQDVDLWSIFDEQHIDILEGVEIIDDILERVRM